MKLQQATKRNSIEILVMVAIIFAIIAYIRSDLIYLVGTFISLGITFISPEIIKPFTRVWLTLGHALGQINSKILLTIIFFIMVTPIAFVRRIVGTNEMTNWKHLCSTKSTFINRNKRFDSADFNRTF